MNTVTQVERWGLVEWVLFLESLTAQEYSWSMRTCVASALYQLVLELSEPGCA